MPSKFCIIATLARRLLYCCRTTESPVVGGRPLPRVAIVIASSFISWVWVTEASLALDTTSESSSTVNVAGATDNSVPVRVLGMVVVLVRDRELTPACLRLTEAGAGLLRKLFPSAALSSYSQSPSRELPRELSRVRCGDRDRPDLEEVDVALFSTVYSVSSFLPRR